jgi:hypothetical protein
MRYFPSRSRPSRVIVRQNMEEPVQHFTSEKNWKTSLPTLEEILRSQDLSPQAPSIPKETEAECADV